MVLSPLTKSKEKIKGFVSKTGLLRQPFFKYKNIHMVILMVKLSESNPSQWGT